MSHAALQKALVIAMHDETFVAAMHDDPDSTLSALSLDLTAPEKQQLLAVDRRAWRTDPLRRRRTLRTIAEELKVSTTLALAETRSLAFAEGFFGSRFFREAVGSRAPLVPAFADYLADAATTLKTPQLPDVIALEATTARMRRAKLAPPPRGIGLAPGVAVRILDGGVLETVNLVERYLFELSLMPQAGLCADAPAIPPLPPVGAAPALLLLFTPSQTGVSLTTIDADLHRVLAALATPRPREHAIAALAAASIPHTRAPALLQSLLEEGLLAEGS